jgi:glycosyltransferase involved in cell wall biosynthesis
MTDQLGQSQVLPYLEGLSRKGHRIHLISFEKPDKFVKLQTQIRKQCEEAAIVWHPLPYTKNPPVLSTLNDLFCMWRKSKQLFKENNFKLVHCRSYLPAMVGSYLQKKFKTKFLFDIRGFWADERVEGNIWKLSNPIFNMIYSFMKKKEKHLLSTADAVISLTEKARPIIREIQIETSRSNPLYTIPCCVDTYLFDPATISDLQKDAARQKLGIDKDTFILSYLGGISTWYLPGEMLDFYASLLGRFPTAVFMIITQEEPFIIEQLLRARNLPEKQIMIFPAQRKEVPLYLSISNAAIFFIKPSFSKQASSPTKQGEIMSMGIPLITNTGIGDTDQIVNASNAGFICTTFTKKSYDVVVSGLQVSSSQEQAAEIRKNAIQYFSLENGVLTYAKIYASLLDQE